MAISLNPYVFSDGVGMIDSVDSLGHQYGLLLRGQRFGVIAHDVIQSGQHTQTLCNLRMHCAVNVVQ